MATSSILEPESVAVLQKLSDHKGDVMTCDFSSSFHLATGSGDKTVFVYEWKQGLGFVETNYSPLTGHKYAVTSVRFSPSATILATASVDGHINLWSVRTGESIQTLVQANGNCIRCLCFSNDGILLASGGEGGIFCVWSITIHSNSLIRAINAHDDESIQGIAFSPDGFILVTGDVTGSFKVWSILSIRESSEFSALFVIRDAHDLGINSLEFSSQYTAHKGETGLMEREYLLVSCGNDQVIGLWQISIIQGGKGSGGQLLPSLPVELIATYSGHNAAVSQARINSKGDLIASTSIDKTTRIWQMSSGRCLKTLEGHSRYVTSCAFSSDQSLLATGSNDKSLIIWDLTGALDFDSALSETTLRRPSISPNYNYKSATKKIIDMVMKLEQHVASVNSVHFSSKFLVSGGSDHRLVIWNRTGLKSLSLLHCLEEAHRYPINQVEICPTSGLLVSCSLDGTVLLWNPESGTIKKSGFHISGSGVRSVRFSPNANLLAAGGDDDIVQVYRTDTCERIISIPGDSEGVTCLAFTPDSNYLMVGSADGHARLYSLRPVSPNPINITENCHDLGITSNDFSETLHAMQKNDGYYELATGGQDYLVKVWNIKVEENSCSVSPVWTLSGHGGGITCVRYSPKLAEMIASTAIDKTCRLWDSYSGDCLHVVESLEGILTCCAFSPDATLLATGAMDKSILIWELPKDLAFRSFLVNRTNQGVNVVASWTVENVNNWLEAFNLPPCNLTGVSLLESPVDDILEQFNLEDSARKNEMKDRLKQLRKDVKDDPPHEFLCPITYQLMRDPVIAADGQSYERSAIESWFSTGHCTSPMTNEPLITMHLEPNVGLREAITKFLNI